MVANRDHSVTLMVVARRPPSEGQHGAHQHVFQEHDSKKISGVFAQSVMLAAAGFVGNGAAHGSAPNVVFDALQPIQLDLRPLRHKVELPLVDAEPDLARLDGQGIEVQWQGPARSNLLHGTQHLHGATGDRLGDLFANSLRTKTKDQGGALVQRGNGTRHIV